MVSYGFDVSKDWVDVVHSDYSRQPKQHWRLDNDQVHLTTFLQEQKIRYPKLRCSVESTGPYHAALLRVCLSLDIPCYLLNPITTKRQTKASVRGTKTDTLDALRIALIGLEADRPINAHTLDPAKSLQRAATKLEQLATVLIGSQAHYELLQPYDSEPLQVAFNECRQQLRSSAKLLRSEALARCDPRVEKLVMSLPGVGQKLAPVLMTEIGDITRFPHAKQLIAYAGLDPIIRQSGTSVHGAGRLTKRGSPHLRRALFIAASIARRYDPDLQAVYERKRTQGKSYRQAVVHVARLLTIRLYAVWQRGTPYVSE